MKYKYEFDTVLGCLSVMGVVEYIPEFCVLKDEEVDRLVIEWDTLKFLSVLPNSSVDVITPHLFRMFKDMLTLEIHAYANEHVVWSEVELLEESHKEK